MRRSANRWIAVGTLAVFSLASFGGLSVSPAHAGSKSRRNLMIGAGAVTGYGLLRHHKKMAAIGAVGTAVAYHNYRAAKKRENRRRSARLHYRRHRRHKRSR